MKWTRSKCGNREYSTLSIGIRDYISMSGEENDNLYGYVYSKNGEQVTYGSFYAGSWDEAEQTAVKRILQCLSQRAEYWNEILNNFKAEVNANETLD